MSESLLVSREADNFAVFLINSEKFTGLGPNLGDTDSRLLEHRSESTFAFLSRLLGLLVLGDVGDGRST